MKKKLGVNIDHVATLRQARRESDPDPVDAAETCEKAGAHSIVAHLREDRRHIHDRDIRAIKNRLKGRLNVEMSLDPEVSKFVIGIRPNQVTLVPERREELTTEGGLDVIKYRDRIQWVNDAMTIKKIEVSLFIDPIQPQIDQTVALGIGIIELHTGRYATAKTSAEAKKELKKIKDMAAYAHQQGLVVNVGHGLKYHNVQPLVEIPEILEFNIGHAIISRAIAVGLKNAVREMLEILKQK